MDSLDEVIHPDAKKESNSQEIGASGREALSGSYIKRVTFTLERFHVGPLATSLEPGLCSFEVFGYKEWSRG